MGFKKGMMPWNKRIKIDRIKFPNMGHFKKNSEETKRKISEATKKAMANLEVRKKISESHKGKTPWNKGKKLNYEHGMLNKKHGKEAKRKMVEAVKKRWENPEYRKRMSEIHKGKPSARKGKTASEETRKRLSESHKGKISYRKGKHHTEEVKIRLSKTSKEAWANPEIRKKMTESNMKRYNDPESLEKIKRKSRKTILKQYESGSFPKQTNTKPEREIKKELISRGYHEGIDFIHQYKFMNKFMCDFCFPKQKVIVEVYGDFWHANPSKYPAGKILHKHQMKGIGRDKSKEAYITKVDNHSWTYLILWEGDIKKNVSECVDKIEKVLAEKKKI